MRKVFLLMVTGLLCHAGAGPAWSQTPASTDLGTMSLEDLLKVEVVSTASKFSQEVREAPASITVVTAEEIRRYGHRTLADVLRSVRGLYTTYDRNYSYIGVRGFARPGDYNTRVLLLVDGHRLNDGTYDMAPIGTDLPLDVSLIEKVEVIRGPGSSLYGTSAFFAVINIVTRSGSQRAGLQVNTYGGSLSTRGGTASFGRLFSEGRELLVSASTYQSAGDALLRFPEFDAADGTPGLATDLDDDDASSVFGSWSAGPLSVRGGVGARHKQVPTASFDTVFGDDRETTEDTRAFLTAAYDAQFGGWSGTIRLGYDYYDYTGNYPYDYDDAGIHVSQDGANSQTVTGEGTFHRRLRGTHLLSLGAEVRYQAKNHQWASDGFSETLDVHTPGTIVGVYAQDEVRIRPSLIANVGVRVDHDPTFGMHLTPRGGLVFLPRPATAIKLLHGRAFRAPNAYERYYFDAMRDGLFTLRPERVHSTEAVWEEYISSRVRTTVTAFLYDAEELIEQRSLETGGGSDLYFVNSGDVEGRGVESEIETKLPGGLSGRLSHTYVVADDTVTDTPFSNSPRHLAKLNLQVPVSRFYLGFEGQFVGERTTLGGESLAPFFVPNLTLTSPVRRHVELTLSVFNLLDHHYADPGAEEHVQQAIRQDGRSFLARANLRF